MSELQTEHVGVAEQMSGFVLEQGVGVRVQVGGTR